MARFVSHNPATGNPLGEYPIATASDVACVLERADVAQERWALQPIRERCRALEKLHAFLAAEADSLASAVNAEIGKPLQEAYGAEILPALDGLEWLAKHAPRILGVRSIAGKRGAVLSPVPFGIVGVIGTWNYPVFLNLSPISFALAAGNAVIWKPSELATHVATLLTGYFEQAGLPVFTLTGDATTGRALCRAGCDKIAFTGGVETGRTILKELAAQGTPSVMELSGNDAMLVCADADVPLAARSAVWGRICNAGQNCLAPQRIYVAREVYQAFLQECRQYIERLRPESDYGPLRTESHRRHVQTLVWDAITRGATLLVGGRNLEERPGYFYTPTLLADCHDGMLAMEQDFFGPVLTVCPVRDEAEAIAAANDCEMVLGASVWTRSLRHGQQIAQQLQVGLVTINDVLLDAADPALPFGGFRASGFGKQRGAMGLEEFTQWRVTTAHPSGGTRRHLFPYRPATLPVLRGLIALKAAKGLPAKLRALRELAQAARQWKQHDSRE